MRSLLPRFWIGPTESLGHRERYLRSDRSQSHRHRLQRPVRDADGAIGKGVVGRRVRIVNDDNQEVAPGVSGEIAVHCDDPIVMLRYWNLPEATAEKLGEGWLRTGDAGFVDADGFLVFQGRLDDMIMASGYRLGPEEVEGTLLAHEAVMEAGVVGLPDPQRGEIVAACVRLKSGFDANDELAVELQDFVKTRLAAHARPRRVEFVTRYPPLRAARPAVPRSGGASLRRMPESTASGRDRPVAPRQLSWRCAGLILSRPQTWPRVRRRWRR